MTVKEVIEIAKHTVLSQISAKQNDTLIKYCIYLGLAELYRKFNLSIKSEVIQTVQEQNQYDMRNADLTQILAIYDKYGKQLQQAVTINDQDYDYKQLNYRSFLLRKPADGYLVVVYKASPPMIQSDDDVLDIPAEFLTALLDFVAYRCHTTLNKDGQLQEANLHYQRFTVSCAELENAGYKVNLSTASLSVQSKGFI